MNWLQSLLSTLVALVRILLRDGWVAMRELLARLRALIAAWCRAWKAGREGRVSDAFCVPIREPAFKQPDPTIYSQGWLMSLGFAVTWDNPDIVLRRGGVEVPSGTLLADTEYEIVARIWNNSTEAPVVGLPVHFVFFGFGIGALGQAIGTRHVNLGVKGGPGHPAFASMTWRTPATPGHYCIQVQLDWFDDANPANNVGQENTNVALAMSPAHFTFRLRNATREPQPFQFEVDTYTVPQAPPCPPQRDRIDDHNTPRRPGSVQVAVPREHDRKTFPAGEGWRIEFEPAEPVLEPGAEIDVAAHITPPPGFKGRQPFNVNAFNRDGLAGGVTLIVQAD